MNNLTPHGPWFVDQVETNPTDSVFHVMAPTNDIGSDDGAWFIAECLDHRIARLIAAAPELLEALEAATKAFPDITRYPVLGDAVSAAIAKARGLQ